MAVLLLACAATLDVVGIFAAPSQLAGAASAPPSFNVRNVRAAGESAFKSDDEIPGFHFVPHSVHKDRPRFNW
jgi:hypothetical protein